MNKVTVTATGRESDKFMLRLPEGMRHHIAEAAKKNGRSMNAEIVQRLALSLEAEHIRTEQPMGHTDLPPGAVVDLGTQVWAERLTQPQNRSDLESLLAVIRAMLRGSGMFDPSTVHPLDSTEEAEPGGAIKSDKTAMLRPLETLEKKPAVKRVTRRKKE